MAKRRSRVNPPDHAGIGTRRVPTPAKSEDAKSEDAKSEDAKSEDALPVRRNSRRCHVCHTLKYVEEADDVEFHVVRMKGQDQADCRWDGNRHVIRIAANKHASLAPLLATMAHEMLHLYLDRAYPQNRAAHGALFKRHADRICRQHTFDRGQF